MAKENKTKYAILGVLSLKPASGYDIKKFCDETISHFWSENYGHIYPVLKQLEEEGLVAKETEINEGKLRNVFSITEAGREKLVEWLSLPPEIPQERHEFLLKTFFSKDIPVQKVIGRLNESKELCKSILVQYLAIEKNLKSHMNDKSQLERGIHYWYLTLRYGVLDMEAKLRWIDESIEMLNSFSK